MEEKIQKQEPAQDIQEILRKRRESLDRVRANLHTIDEFQKKFAAENTRFRQASETETSKRTLDSIAAADVKMITIEDLSISVLLLTDKEVRIPYTTREALSSALNAWRKSAPPSELKKVRMPHGFGA